MKRLFSFLLIVFSLNAAAQDYKQYDTVVITALQGQAYNKVPYSLQGVKIAALRNTPRPQLMNHLTNLPSVSSISSGNGINKPVIRGLSFNHIQLFAQGTRIDNQTWDDRHDIGISDNGFTKVEIVNGPAALLYGPNAMGGALVFHEEAPAVNEKNGFAQLGIFSNSAGANLYAGYREGKEKFYYSLNVAGQMHSNYVQGGGKVTDTSTGDKIKALGFNSKYTNIAFKGTIGIRKEKSTHQLSYNFYDQLLGIIEDEALELQNNPEKKEERDYEMEAPYQNVMNHILTLENKIRTGKSQWVINAGYQFNARKEYEPGPVVKSKYLGVGLDLSTITAEVQWHSHVDKPAGVIIGAQGFYQTNKNVGNWVLVPDAHIYTAGAFFLAHWDLPQWNFLLGARIDRHQLKMFNTPAPIADTLNPPVTEPAQQITREYTPGSFSFGIVHRPSEDFSIKLNLANGFSAPNYAQLTSFGHHEGTYRFEVGNNNLKMERNLEADLTLQWQQQDIEISVNGYINLLKNYVYITPTADSAGPLRIWNWVQRDATISGIELNFLVHPANAKWFEGWIRGGFIRGKLKGSNGDLPYIPANKLITGFTLKKESLGNWHQLYATLQVNTFGKQNKTAAFEDPTKGYVLTDIFIGGTPGWGKNHRWSLTAFCQNLFNKAYFNHLSLIKSINVKEPGRNIGLQGRYTL